jgi:hypothetical protein
LTGSVALIVVRVTIVKRLSATSLSALEHTVAFASAREMKNAPSIRLVVPPVGVVAEIRSVRR